MTLQRLHRERSPAVHVAAPAEHHRLLHRSRHRVQHRLFQRLVSALWHPAERAGERPRRDSVPHLVEIGREPFGQHLAPVDFPVDAHAVESRSARTDRAERREVNVVAVLVVRRSAEVHRAPVLVVLPAVERPVNELCSCRERCVQRPRERLRRASRVLRRELPIPRLPVGSLAARVVPAVSEAKRRREREQVREVPAHPRGVRARDRSHAHAAPVDDTARAEPAEVLPDTGEHAPTREAEVLHVASHARDTTASRDGVDLVDAILAEGARELGTHDSFVPRQVEHVAVHGIVEPHVIAPR